MVSAPEDHDIPTYQLQLQKVVDALRRRQRQDAGPHYGGWGFLPEPGAPSSIVNTAEAVAVFSLAGVRPDDDALLAALSYLREKVTAHPTAIGSGPESRGNKTRYAAFGLMGLTVYPQPIENEAHAQAIAACVKWLSHNTLEEGLDVSLYGQGWAERPNRREVSILSTSVAAQAFDRVPSGVRGAGASRKLASNARRRIRSLARGDSTKRWWPTRASVNESATDAAASAALTALSVLCLAEGGPLSQDYARAGVRWLLDNPERWQQQQREPEENIHDTNWTHASCPMALGAVLVPCAGVDPGRSDLAIAISYLDRLWSSTDGEWRHGHPSAEVSTSGDFHAAMALRALRRSWRGFDPVKHILGGERTGTDTPTFGGDKPHTVSWIDGTLIVLSADGTQLLRRSFVARATAMRALLDCLVQRWRDQGRSTLERRSIPTHELRDATGIKDVYEYMRRLNGAASKASLDQRGRRCVIIERIESGKGTDHDRYALLGQELIYE